LTGLVSPELPLDLGTAISLEDGRRLIDNAGDSLTADVVVVLDAAAETATTQDPEAAVELKDWAGWAKARRAWQVLLSTPPSDLDDAKRRIAETGLDDCFFQVGLADVRGLLGLDAQEGARQAVATRGWALATAAALSGQPAHMATAALANGLAVVWPQFRAEQDGRKPDTSALTEARSHLELCADQEAAGVALRAEALAKLAWIAEDIEPGRVDDYLERSEELQAAWPGRDLDNLRTVRRDLARRALSTQDYREALRLYEANLTDTEHDLRGAKHFNYANVIVRDSANDYNGAVGAALKLGEHQQAVALAEDGKAAAFTQAASVLGVARKRSPFLAHRLEVIKAEVALLAQRLNTAPTEERPAIKRRLRCALDAYGRTGQALSGTVLARHLALWGRRSVEDISRLVPAGGAYVSYHWSPTRTVIGVIGEHGLVAPPIEVKVRADDLGDDEIGRAAFNLMLTIRMRGDYRSVEDMQRHLDQRMEMFWPNQSQRFLYDKLIAPVAEQLAPFSTLVISPSGRLGGLPFHAFVSPAGRALVEDHAIIYTNGPKVLGLMQGQRRSSLETCFCTGTAAAGGPPRAWEEARLVASLFGAAPWSATIEAVLKEGAQADVVHLACHSDLRSGLTPTSGLALDDGTLTVAQIEHADFAATVVTLSACMTAATDVDPLLTEDEMAGMVGAFARAGVPTVVATLWPLPDQVAVLFADAFYTPLLKGAPAAVALQQAQLTVKATFDHPYFWAPFAIWGDGGTPLARPKPS
jgi:CHAT domain